MVLKYNLFILSLSFILTLRMPVAVAKNYQLRNKTFYKAVNSFKEKRYKKTITLLKKIYPLKSKNTPAAVLQLAAYSYQELNKLHKAQSLYKRLIKKQYRKIHYKIMKSYKNNQNADDLPDDIPNKLLEIYHKRIKLLTTIYKRDFDKFNYKKMMSLQKEIRKYVEILTESDYDDDTVDELIAQIDKFNKDRSDKVLRNNFYFSLGFVSWKDIIILHLPDGGETNIKSTSEGLNLCAGNKFENAHLILKLALCFASSVSDVGNETDSINYFQKSVSISMYSLMPAVLWKPYQGDTAIGISIPLAYRTGDFSTPPNHRLSKTQIYSYGYLLNYLWLWKPISVELLIGKIENFSSSYWGLNTIYEF